jgi:hypothetical protein
VVRDCLHIRRYPVVEVLGVAEEVKQQWMYLDDYIAMNEDDEGVMTRYVAFLKDLKEDEMNEEVVTDPVIDLMVMWLKDTENPLYDEDTNARMKAKIEEALRSKTEDLLIYGYTLTEAKEILSHQKEIRIEAVRRFVKRVRGQMSVGASFEDLDRALKGELALMEGE